MAQPGTTLKTEIPAPPTSSLGARVWHAFLHNFWYVQPTTYLLVNLSPGLCMQRLVTLAKPSVKRLEYRNLFAQGRRYFFSQRQGDTSGFYMSSTHKLLWSRQRRTQTSAIIMGEFVPLDEDATRLVLQARMRLAYMLDVLPLPLFTTSLIIFMPWHPAWIISLIVALFSLSWVAHRAHARLEAHTMTYFIEQALEHHLRQPHLLANQGAHLVYDDKVADFGQAWRRFMNEQGIEQDPDTQP